MSQNRSALFRGRHFEDVIIILCVRWYLRYSLSYRDLEEMMAERCLSVDHVTIWRWVQHYADCLPVKRFVTASACIHAMATAGGTCPRPSGCAGPCGKSGT